MSDRKLILPTEIKVCATCTYWDGDRVVDEDLRVVVVCESCKGECLVTESQMSALERGVPVCECLWDDLHADEAPAEAREEAPAIKKTGS